MSDSGKARKKRTRSALTKACKRAYDYWQANPEANAKFLAKKFRLSLEDLYKYLNKRNLSLDRGPDFIQPTKRALSGMIFRMHSKGYTISDIQEYTGLTWWQVYKAKEKAQKYLEEKGKMIDED